MKKCVIMILLLLMVFPLFGFDQKLIEGDPFAQSVIHQTKYTLFYLHYMSVIKDVIMFAAYALGLIIAMMGSLDSKVILKQDNPNLLSDIQKVNRIRKIVLPILGIIVACLTYINSNLLSYDKKSAQKAAYAGDLLEPEIMLSLQQFIETKDDLYHKRMYKYLEELVGLKNNFINLKDSGLTYTNPKSVSTSLLLIKKVYAEDGNIPVWANKYPEDNKIIYFIGIAENQVRETAESSSLSIATENERKEFIRQLQKNSDGNINIDKLADYLVRKSSIIATFTSNINLVSYKSYTLLGINREIIPDLLFLYETEFQTSIQEKDTLIQNLRTINNTY